VLSTGEGFLDTNVQDNLDSLVGGASNPPRLGQAPLSYQHGNITVSHDGRPDWGFLKVIDPNPWIQPSRVWAEKRQMPHYGYGSLFNPITLDEVKWVNEGGLYDTINLNYRDAETTSYFGFGDDQYTHGGSTLIAQSVPREALRQLDPEQVYPFLYKPSYFSENEGDLFNSTHTKSVGFSAGQGSATLGFKNLNGDTSTITPSLSLTPYSTQTYNPFVSETLAGDPDDLGLVISGVLYPADRGVVALIRFSSEEFDISTGFNGMAQDATEVLNRCVAAINLGQGIGPNDGLPGGIFSEGSEGAFPSREAGQFDLYELHTGNYPPHYSRTGANHNVSDPGFHRGQVRLLKDPLAFNVQDNTYSLGIPVLFSPYEFMRSLETAVVREERNFLSYRMPMLKDYTANALSIPVEDRERFFTKNLPNKDQEKVGYSPYFESAGGYVTFGEDKPTAQVARYRHCVDLMDLASDTYPALSSDSTHLEYNFGSFALVHFKTEASFERLVRDGIAPSNEEVYSVNLIDYSDPANNIGQSIGSNNDLGVVSSAEGFTGVQNLSLFRPNVNFEMKHTTPYYGSGSIETSSRVEFLHSYEDNLNRGKLQRYNTYFSFISGVIYVHPTSPFSYDGHISKRGGVPDPVRVEEQRNLRVRLDVEFDARTDDSYSEWKYTEATSNQPYASVRPLAQVLTSSLTATDNLSIIHSGEGGVKHQSTWLEGEMGTLVVYAKGDSVKPVSLLEEWDKKDGFCTFSTSATRTSILVNKPHRHLDNVGVEVVLDDVEATTGNNAKLLYHSARKLSLLELYGRRLSPVGEVRTTSSSSNITQMSDYYTLSGNQEAPYGDFNHNFLEVYLFAGWQNTIESTDPAHITTTTSPRRAGQSFSIYRYDEEGYKVYQPLTLLPIAGSESNGYALELCSGWNRVDENDADVETPEGYQYPSDRPVYRPTSSDLTFLDVFASAKFLMVKGVEYYVECYSSVPLTDPSTLDENSVNESILSLGATGKPDLLLGFALEQNPVDIWVQGFYLELYANLHGIPTGQCEWLGQDMDPAIAPFDTDPVANVGYVSFVRAFEFELSSEELVLYDSPTHPHPRPSLDHNGYINYGIVWIEVPPTGNRELPEYGNFTQDLRGYITVSGLGNEPFYSEDQIHAVAPVNNTRIPLRSLFTLRKDTQERFLDESYRIESTLYHLFKDPTDPETSIRYSNTDNNSLTEAFILGNTNTLIKDNLSGPGLPNPSEGVNGGYIAVPVRDISTLTAKAFDSYVTFGRPQVFQATAGHGGAGYLRNSWHARRAFFSSDPNTPDWREAQVMGLPDLARNHLTGGKYGTPPRGVLVYPYWDFDGNTNSTLEGQDLTTNPLIASSKGYHLPNTGKNTGDDREGDDWIDDDVVATSPKLRHAQPNYETSALLNEIADPMDYPDVGYLRAFDVNFGGNPVLTPQAPYWNKDWYELPPEGGEVYHSAREAQNYGLIEQGWVRATKDETGQVQFAPVKLRLVGVDWDMISYIDPQFPLQRRDGLVHTINGARYLMRKRVMRVYVKVPGLTTWLDVGVMDGEYGESYRHFIGDKTDVDAGLLDPNGPTNDKASTLVDGAGCCTSYHEKYLVDEGVVCVDLDLNLGIVPAFNPDGNYYDPFDPSAADANLSVDEYLGLKQDIRVDNCLIDKTYTRDTRGIDPEVAGASNNFQAPILVKVLLSHPDYPKYERHPGDATKLVDVNDINNLTLEVADIANDTPANETIIDIHPTPMKSYRGHSFPPDDRAPLWARRGLMGIEVLRPDGTNYDRDVAIERPSYTSLDLYANPTLYYARSTNGGLFESYLKETSSLTNKATYTYGEHSARELGDEFKKPLKGEG
jgi:hypothetical protein